VTALLASVLLTLYLLVPSSLFRLSLGFFVPLRSFVRTSGEEVLQAALSTLCPIALALVLVWTTPPFKNHPFGFADNRRIRQADYKLVIASVYSEEVFKKSGDLFWEALARAGRRQARFLCWYYVLIILEGWAIGKLAVSYPRLANRRWYLWTFENILVSNISEWHLLLTNFFFQDKRTLVLADILCSDNTLYRGVVASHSLSKESALAGVIITEAKRFTRDAYHTDKLTKAVNKEEYWRTIPGTKFYIFADKILNLNLSYEGPEPPPKVMEEVISRRLNQAISLTVETQTKKG
jgi:hypothetical protein